MQKTLDLSIKKHEIGTTEGGYDVKTAEKKTTYLSYMDGLEWEKFEKDMKDKYPNAYNEYGAGSGGELKEKGKFPPKMASFGSSSRMIFNFSKDIEGFKFEEKLPTTVGGIANMDGYLEKEDKHIFVEAKCREPYGAKPHLIEDRYEKLYQYIDKDDESNLKIKISDIEISETTKTKNESKMNVTFSVGDSEISNFDIKQMICHLLGIATKFLDVPTKKKISFLYFCYNPKLIEIIDEKKQERIYDTYDKMCRQCNSIDFKGLFSVIVRYLKENKKNCNVDSAYVNQMIDNFSFTLCDQASYMGLLK